MMLGFATYDDTVGGDGGAAALTVSMALFSVVPPAPEQLRL